MAVLQAVKIKLEIEKKFKFVQLDFSNLIFQKLSADQMGAKDSKKYPKGALKIHVYNLASNRVKSSVF
jgi:hypothetical protein